MGDLSESLQRVGDDSLAELNKRFDHLEGGYKLMVESYQALEAKMDSKMESVLSAISKLQKARMHNESNPIEIRSPSKTPYPLTNSHLEHNRNESSLGYQIQSQPVGEKQTRNANPDLELTLQQILHVITPTQSDCNHRCKVLNDLGRVLESVDGFRGATIVPFGSFLSNLFTKWGDLDISIDVHRGPLIVPTERTKILTLLSRLYQPMAASGLWSNLQSISDARVPIMKGLSRYYPDISFDISIDNLKGLLKSRFLLWISEIDRRFRNLVLLVKNWAKTHHINSSKEGTFSSYALCLLVIFHLQTCEPAILPPLRDIYPRNAAGDLKGVRKSAEESIAQISAANIARFKSGSTSSVNKSSLSELFVSFIEKFSDIKLKATDLGVCPYTGRWESRTNNTRWFLPQTDSLFVEDPFDQPENTTRGVSLQNLDEIAEVFQDTLHGLRSVTERDSLVKLLTGPR